MNPVELAKEVKNLETFTRKCSNLELSLTRLPREHITKLFYSVKEEVEKRRVITRKRNLTLIIGWKTTRKGLTTPFTEMTKTGVRTARAISVSAKES